MRPFAPQLSRSINTPTLTQARAVPATSYSFNPATLTFSQRDPFTSHNQSKMASTEAGELRIENSNVKSATGVDLSESQKTLVGSVLDLFAGRPSLAKLQLWKDDGEFVDPICIAKGRKQYEAQWYGLQTAFSEIERLHHEVTSAGNPIEMDMKTRYVVKGINKEQIIQSKILIHTDGDKIAKVEDKWDGKMPDSGIANAFRRLNAMTTPNLVGVPKTAEEDAKRGN